MNYVIRKNISVYLNKLGNFILASTFIYINLKFYFYRITMKNSIAQAKTDLVENFEMISEEEFNKIQDNSLQQSKLNLNQIFKIK